MQVPVRKERRWTWHARGCTLCLSKFHFLHKHVRSHVDLVAFVLDAVCNHCAQEHGKKHAGCRNRGCACPCPDEG
jgi:hypothetical protein